MTALDISEQEVAAEAFGLLRIDLPDVVHSGGPWRGTTYDDGESDWTIQYTNKLTGEWVTVWVYAHDSQPKAGPVHDKE